MADARTNEETLAEVEAWWAAQEGEQPIGAADAAQVLDTLLARASRTHADLRDPTPELLRWLTRDLARDDDVSDEEYDAAILTLTGYLLYLRGAHRWRRSERTVQACWDVLGWARRMPLGLRDLGEPVDAAIAEALELPPAVGALLEVGSRLPFVRPMRTALAALAARGQLSTAEVVALLETSMDAVERDVFLRALADAALLQVDTAGVLRPTPEVTDAGGCPPPSTLLLERLVSGLVWAVLDRAVGADTAMGLDLLPRGIATGAALVLGTDVTSEEEEETRATVATLIGSRLPDGDDRREPFTDEVLASLSMLAGFGLLERTELPHGEALRVPEALRHQVVRAVADYTGCVGTEDVAPEWQPVDLPSRLRPDDAVELVVSLEQLPEVRRRLRVRASESLAMLHVLLQRSLGWRGMRDHVLSVDGVRRFAAPSVLRSLVADEDEAVTDASSAAIGAVLAAAGDELLYSYGALTNPWQFRVRVEQVVAGTDEPVAWLESQGDVPAEPSLMWEQLQPRLPSGMVIAPELESAWVFMESQGWGAVAPAGHALLAPGPPQARPGVVFSAGLSLDGWGDLDAAASRMLAIAASPDGTRLALWVDDGGATRVVGLGPDGGAFVVADAAADLVRLAAVGYPEVSQATLGRPPSSPEAVAGVAEFRAWVQGDLGLPVPSVWPAGDDGVELVPAAQSGERAGRGSAG